MSNFINHLWVIKTKTKKNHEIVKKKIILNPKSNLSLKKIFIKKNKNLKKKNFHFEKNTENIFSSRIIDKEEFERICKNNQNAKIFENDNLLINSKKNIFLENSKKKFFLKMKKFIIKKILIGNIQVIV